MVRIVLTLLVIGMGTLAQGLAAATVRVYSAGAIPNPYVVARILDPSHTFTTTTRGLHRNLHQAPASDSIDVGRDLREERINAAAQAAVRSWQARLHRPARQATLAARTDTTGQPAPASALALAVEFSHNSARLSPRSLAALDAVAAGIKLTRGSSRILIEGHTDARGNAAHNLRLSQRRAISVKRYLVRTHAIAADRLVALGLGANAPLNRNNRFAAENRRVQFRAIQTS